MKNLYFIALLPPKDIQESIKFLKEEFNEKYKAKYALKLPAHITLQIPFRLEEKEEHILIQSMEAFVVQQEPFEICLSGFGTFSSRAIFVRVANHEPLRNIHTNLQKHLKRKLELNNCEKEVIHPHMTIATRDLKKDKFHKAWNEFKNREIKASFTVNSLFLFKHNGETWDIHSEIIFEQ